MKVNNCDDTTGMAVSPEAYNCCMFEVVDTWDPTQHAKTCDTMFYLSDGTGAYVWDGKDWLFLSFAGGDFVKTKVFETYKAAQEERDAKQDERLTDLESKITDVPKITQIRTTIGVDGREDSSIFNKDVISNADLLWTKQELPEGNSVLVNGHFTVKTAQPDSYKNVFWTTPEGFELKDDFLQFVPIMHWTPVTAASLNPNVDVSGVKAWTNFASLSADVFMIDKTLRAK